MIVKLKQVIIVCSVLSLFLVGSSAAQEPSKEVELVKEGELVSEQPVVPTAPENVTLDFKDADILNVLRILSYKSGVNIVAAKEVTGLVTVRLVNVPWEQALDVILKTYGFGYERQGDIITVTTFEKLQERRQQEKSIAEVEPVVSEVFIMKYLDAVDAKKTIEPLLTSRGKVTVVETRGNRGWEFGAEKTGKRERTTEDKETMRSSTLIVLDTASNLEKIKVVIAKIDTMPQQILIEARIVEVNEDKLKDLGIDWATGSAGVESSAMTGVATEKSGGGNVKATLAAHNLGAQVAPSTFDSKATIAKVEPFDAGLEILYQKLSGTQFEVMLHALEENVHANILSAPRIMTLSNQEATILVGQKYPILSETASEATTTVAKSLDYYQDIGIQLNVVPQVCDDEYISMIVHPAITSFYGWVASNYPIITTRETETQVLIRDGETVVIGGLIKDVKDESKISIPILGNIPILGMLFQRKNTDIQKIDLLIFITARIVRWEDKSVGADVASSSEPAAGLVSENNPVR